MIWCLLLLCLTGQDDELDQKPGPNKRFPLIAWWDQTEFCTTIGIPEPQRLKFVKELNNFQISYQLEQTKLNEARTKQTQLFLDPKSSPEVLTAFNNAEVVGPTERMQAINFKARLWVRSQLTPAQLEALTHHSPQFFTTRWFKPNTQVRQGKVLPKK